MDPHMKEAMRRKLSGLDKGGHGKPTLDMQAPDANPHAPDMHDHDGDVDDNDYDKLNPSDRAPDLKEKNGDLLMDDHGPIPTNPAGDLKRENEIAAMKSKGNPATDAKEPAPLGRKLNLSERGQLNKTKAMKK